MAPRTVNYMGSEFPYGKGTIEGDIVGHATGRYTRAHS